MLQRKLTKLKKQQLKEFAVLIKVDKQPNDSKAHLIEMNKSDKKCKNDEYDFRLWIMITYAKAYRYASISL